MTVVTVKTVITEIKVITLLTVGKRKFTLVTFRCAHHEPEAWPTAWLRGAGRGAGRLPRVQDQGQPRDLQDTMEA